MAEVDSAGLEVLDHAECLRLLRSVPVGRVVFSDQALPAVQPVNFVVLDGAIWFRTGEGSKLAAAARGAIVAFEADEFDEELRSGWSVSVIGQAEEVRDAELVHAVRRLPLRTWAPGRRDHLIRIGVHGITGRRLRWPTSETAAEPA